jgi:hypothetical protein
MACAPGHISLSTRRSSFFHSPLPAALTSTGPADAAETAADNCVVADVFTPARGVSPVIFEMMSSTAREW